MASEHEHTADRRALLKGSVIAGAAAWVAPVVLAQPAAAASPPTPTTTTPPSGCGSAVGGTFTIPAFALASFTDMLIGGCNTTTWGIEVDGVSVISGPNAGASCALVFPSDFSLPPASTARTARMYLRDASCFSGAPVTYFTDHTSTGGSGSVDHSLVSPAGPGSWTVWLTDGGGGCGQRDANRVPVPNTDYNFRATVSMICSS